MSIYRRKSGHYAVLIDLEPSATGLRRRKSIGTFHTRKEAERAEREALQARDRGIDLSPKTVTVREIIARYIERCKTANRAPATVTRYEELARHINDKLGEIPLAKLKPAHVTELHASAARKGLSPKSIHHVHGLLNAALSWAAERELVLRNVAKLTAKDLPKVPTSLARALTEAEARAILAASDGTPWQAFITLALTTGARRSEIAALRWSCIDFERRSARIEASLTLTQDGSVEFKGTKTNTVRVVPLSAPAIEALRAQKARQAEERLRAGALYRSNDLVFADALGQPWNPRSISNGFARIAKLADVRVRLHDTRHSAATWMLQAGTDVRTVAAVLGHTDATTTLRTYSHVMPGATEAAVDAIAERLRRQA